MINITSAIALGISCSGFSFSISSVHYNSGSASGRSSPWSSRASNAALLVIRGRGGGVPVISSSGASDATRACVAVSYYNKIAASNFTFPPTAEMQRAPLPYQGNLYRKDKFRSF